ncbi:MAG: hypothetical protein MUD08_08445, partial [Cytophagales bacterium]|nr:hypothetical protein [Cytophagales bacterium]
IRRFKQFLPKTLLALQTDVTHGFGQNCLKRIFMVLKEKRIRTAMKMPGPRPFCPCCVRVP